MAERIYTNNLVDASHGRKTLLVYSLSAVLVLIGILAIRFVAQSGSTASHLPGKTVISQSELAEKTGLQITLVAVTAAGGMVDLRFKVLDVGKARQTLKDGTLLPELAVAGSKTTLKPSQDTSGDIRLENGLVYYLLYGNNGNLVKPGTPVSVIFGEWQVEPIAAQ